MDTGKEHIGGRIRQIRKRLGRSQKELGLELGGLSDSSISGYEAGEAYPTPEVLAKIAQMGSVSLDWLVTGQEEKPRGGPDYRLDEVNRIWGLVSEPARNELYQRAQELAPDHFPYAEEAGRFPEHSRERALFIQSKAFAELGIGPIDMQVTRGLDDYLAGRIPDGRFYALCGEEARKLLEMLRKRIVT
ncbi:MAG: helix-turn-helix transcriptional regulator [Desulfobacteraceae bacterium]|nr:helix-turn-helix transcriptional regulator [Desulfobacteraceae bacterium]